ncbi:MAG: carbonic anhydrase, partial [Burkholderia sp.]|nr:carbonic anhydrase [Burkholderia sp.]
MNTASEIANGEKQGLVEEVLTKEEQASLTPDRVIALLTEGNDRFVSGEVTLRNHNEQIRRAVAGQYPKAVVLSCLDSRIPVEDVFDRGIGDMFVARVAGNTINVDILGSMEFACKVAGAKLVVVMGHELCGAVMGAIDGVQMGHITALLGKIRPATLRTDGFEGARTS